MTLPFHASAVFAELNGFVLLDPDGLDRWARAAGLGTSAHGVAVLDAMTTSDAGDVACAEGFAMPLAGIGTGSYDLYVLRDSDPSPIARPAATSAGWVFRSLQGRAAVCGLGYLARWDPNYPGVRSFTVAPGWYEVVARGGHDRRGRWAIEWRLTLCGERPKLTARPDRPFPLDLDSDDPPPV